MTDRTQKIKEFFDSKPNHIVYPVVEKEHKLGVYHPLPFYEENAWQNKNRILRTTEEENEMMREAFGTEYFQPAQFWVVLEEYSATHQTVVKSWDGSILNVKDPDSSGARNWTIGKIIRLGLGCFSTDRFPLGAEASIGDYVMIDGSNVIRIRTKNNPICLVQDVNIKGLVGNPFSLVNS